jgi:hypothetical protein
MPQRTFSPSLPTTPTQSWTQDSTLDDVQQEPQSEVPDEGVFEKKWIVTEDGDDSASYFPLSISSWSDNSSSGEFSSRYAALGPLPFCFKRCYPGLPVPGWHRQEWYLLRPQHRFQFGDNRGCVSYPPTCNTESPNLTPIEWEDESPYPEVRAAVSNTDDMEMPAGTFRSWIIGLFWAIFIPGLNQFFHFRYPSVTIGSVRHPFPHICEPGKRGGGVGWLDFLL